METEKLNRFLQIRNVVVRWIVGIVSVLALLLVLLNIARIGTAYWIYSDIFQWATVNLGLDKYLAMTTATLLTTALLFSLPWLAWIFLFGKRRTYAILAISASICVFGLVNHYAGKDVNFDRRNGKPLKYYAMTPEGAIYSFSPGFDPKYGVAYKPLTQQAINSLEASSGQSDSAGITLPQYRVSYDLLNYNSLKLLEIGYAEGRLEPYVKFENCNGDNWPTTAVKLRFRKNEQGPVLASWDWTKPTFGWSGCGATIFLKAGEGSRQRYVFGPGVFEVVDAKDTDHVLFRSTVGAAMRTSL